MALRISMGQYLPGDSPLHRLDPRVKLGGTLILVLSAFGIDTPTQLLLGLAGIVALFACARVPLAKVAASIRPVVAILAFLAVFNLFFVQEGEPLWRWGVLGITTGSVRVAVIYSLRLVIATLAAALMLLTTTPTQITDACDAALSPLAKLGLPGHELAMVFSLMLRFIPTLADETQAILDAQTMRGAPIGEGSPLRRAQSLIPVLIALLASSAHHADGLARALDARSYVGGATRSHWHPMRMRPRDWLALALLAAYVVALVAAGLLAVTL